MNIKLKPKKTQQMELTKRQVEFLDILEKTFGNITTTLENTKTERYEFDQWMEEFIFMSRYEQVQEKTIDYVENKLLQQINEGNLTAITFFLKTKGKNRGYV